MTLKCPSCGYETLDYKASFGLWKCVRADCGYKRKRKTEEKNPHIISVFGKNDNNTNEKVP